MRATVMRARLYAMRLVRSVVVIGWGLLLSLGCSDDEQTGEECTLPNEPEFEVTATILQMGSSHEDCPAEVPAGLSSDEIESQGLCEQEISDCIIHLNCDVSGVVVEGRLGERDGNLVGRVEVTKPLKCVYEVTGKFR